MFKDHRAIVATVIFLGVTPLFSGQSAGQSLTTFFEKRLQDPADAPPPSYEVLLKVVDSIPTLSTAEVEAALTPLTTALASKTNNLAVEAAFALSEIARRPDGGSLLRSRASVLGALLANKDERLSGGAVLALGHLHRTTPDVTMPILTGYLDGEEQPSLVKAQIVRIILESKLVDESVARLVVRYLQRAATPEIKVANLHAIVASDSRSQTLVPFAISSLNDSNKHVKMAAIQAVNSLGLSARSMALASGKTART